MKNRIKSLYLAIALTTKCNFRCFYCKEGGESISESKEEIPFDELKRIITIAYDIGINSFRITGGEPTIASYFGELLKFIVELGNDTRIRINTNGYNLQQFVDIIQAHKERFDIVISIDSLSEYINGVHYPKYLSKKIQILTKDLVNRGITVRYNVVVTKINFTEIEQLIIKAVDEMKVNLKLLDLNKQEEYLGEKEIKNAYQEMSTQLWNDLYVPLEKLQPFLENISEQYKPEYHQWISYGIPMSAYFRNGHMIQLKDSSKGANYSKICIEKCPYFKTCQEGVFSPFLSTNLILHVSGCKNTDIHFDLKGKDEYSIRNSFNKILKLFEDVSIQKNF